MTEMRTLPSQAAASTDPANVLQPLALRSMFWRPAYLEASAWLEHIPFAFWLIEAQRPKVFVELGTQHGTSYLSFCQAVDRLQLDTRCFAVDTWKGDAQTGPYDEKVFNSVRARNDAQYAGFSRLLRSSFDDALDRFTDGSIDLLHMDGLPTAEAVGHDVERWLPKMSERGVIVVHNTNTRERDVDVFKLFERLQEQYPAFEFLHGNGLGVLAVGPQQDGLLRHLFDANSNEAAKRSVQEMFSRLGRCCADVHANAQQQERAGKLGMEIGKQKKLFEEAELSLKKAKEELSSRTRELGEARARLQAQADQHTLERGQLTERAALLQELRSELKAEVLRLQDGADTMVAELQRRADEVSRLELAYATSRQQSDVSAKTVEEEEARSAALRTKCNRLEADIADLHTRMDEREQDLTHTRSSADALALQVAAIISELQQRDVKIAELTQQENDRQAHLESLQKQLVQRGQDLAAARIAEQELTNVQRTVDALTAQVTSSSTELQQRDATIAALTRQDHARQAQLESIQEQLMQRSEELAVARSEQQAQEQRINHLESDRMQRDERIVALSQQDEIARAALRASEARLAQREEELTAYEAQAAQFARLAEQNAAIQAQLEQVRMQLAAAAQPQATSEQQERIASQAVEIDRQARVIAALEADKAALGANVQQRFRELAKLTHMLEAARMAQQHAAPAAEPTEPRPEVAENERLVAELARKEEQVRSLLQKLAVNAASQADRPLRSSSFRLFGAAGPHARLEKKERKLRKQAQLIRESGLFDEVWYLARYPDVKQSGMDPAAHFLHYGAAEMRDPSAFFDTKAYVAANSDVVESQINPLVHYINHGSKEGRMIESVKES